MQTSISEIFLRVIVMVSVVRVTWVLGHTCSPGGRDAGIHIWESWRPANTVRVSSSPHRMMSQLVPGVALVCQTSSISIARISPKWRTGISVLGLEETGVGTRHPEYVLLAVFHLILKVCVICVWLETEWNSGQPHKKAALFLDLQPLKFWSPYPAQWSE